MGTEGGAVYIADSADDFIDGETGFGEQGTGVLDPHVLQIDLKWYADDLLEFSADEGGVQKSFVADLGQRDVVHIILVDVVSNVDDGVVFIFLFGNLLFDGLNEDLGNIASEQVSITRLPFFIGFPSLFKDATKLIFLVAVIVVDD